MYILFYEQAVYERGTKTKKKTLLIIKNKVALTLLAYLEIQQEICIYYSTNKQYMNGVQKRKKTLLIIENKTALAMLA